jgi:hypothetical protein
MAKKIHSYRIMVRGTLPPALNERVASIHASAILALGQRTERTIAEKMNNIVRDLLLK